MADKKENTKTLAQNKKARHEYFILETIEAGIELAGTEVKSARLGKVNLTDAYASIKNGEVFIKQMNISLLNREIYLIVTLLGTENFFFIRKKY